MISFLVIGISDSPQPACSDEVKRVIDGGKVFSGGLRHHEIVGDLLPDGAQWIDITVPLSDVYRQYRDVDDKIIIFGISEKLLTAYFDSLTCTKPTGAAITPTGCALPWRISSQSSNNAVGALPKTKRASGCSSTPSLIPAWVRVIPYFSDISATRESCR